MSNSEIQALWQVSRHRGLELLFDSVREDIRVIEAGMLTESDPQRQLQLLGQWTSAKKTLANMEMLISNACAQYEDIVSKQGAAMFEFGNLNQ